MMSDFLDEIGAREDARREVLHNQHWAPVIAQGDVTEMFPDWVKAEIRSIQDGIVTVRLAPGNAELRLKVDAISQFLHTCRRMQDA